MPAPVGSFATLPRRSFLAALGGMAILHCGTSLATAQTVGAQTLAAPQPTPFDFDWLTEDARRRATDPVVEITRAEGFFSDFTYDDYQAVQFNPAQSRFAGPQAGFHLHAFHLGWLFAEPVILNEVDPATATTTPILFSTDDFFYYDLIKDRVPPHEPLPGVAGFRLNAPLNRADLFDEVVAFLGASYFRAVSRGTGYGLSARGLAINTAMGTPEEFPRFTQFWIEKPVPFAREITVFAALDSDSCTGAYRFVIRPGTNTVMDVTARLFFRTEVDQIGIAPLTSMFLFSEKNRADFDDFRPNVHDSDGLIIHRRDGDQIWRPLNNPPRLSESWLVEESPTAFGLMQRDRDFANYQDAVSHYERRPSLMVEPLGDWGRGAVRLVEIPSRQEINDNIVAFWVPEAVPTPGTLAEFSYRLTWGALPADPTGDIAYVAETRAGAGGVSGSENTDGHRKFVVDFAGGMLAALPADAMIDAVASVAGGDIVIKTLSKIEGENIWRMVLDVLPQAGDVVELRAHIAGYGRKLTEDWIYQWVPA